MIQESFMYYIFWSKKMIKPENDVLECTVSWNHISKLIRQHLLKIRIVVLE